MARGKRITEKEIKKIKLLDSVGLKTGQIARIAEVSSPTVNRVRLSGFDWITYKALSVEANSKQVAPKEVEPKQAITSPPAKADIAEEMLSLLKKIEENTRPEEIQSLLIKIERNTEPMVALYQEFGGEEKI